MVKAVRGKIPCERLADQRVIDLRGEPVYPFAGPPYVHAADGHHLIHVREVVGLPVSVGDQQKRKERRHDAPVRYILDQADAARLAVQDFLRLGIHLPQIRPEIGIRPVKLPDPYVRRVG